eukprot:TRINITY_DN15903_c0_g1_i1.p1 TRINITY_DN15903_c0_g1~~TRINITY_DN15903_c0_g1_i1.p1  ORF type:complete len:278 (-),score=42.02 TRINITY_DN15903_c0_g1_i1:51-884(-)
MFFLFVFVSVCAAIGNGVDLQPSYYNGGSVTFGWDLMHQYKQITTVRIEIEPFVNIDQAVSWIREANTQGYNVIATYHRYQDNGSDDPNALMNGANWWVQNWDKLKDVNFTVNLMNEWGSHNQNSDTYSNAYNNAISKVRQVYSGPIIIDIPGWGQETRVASEASPKIKDQSIIFSAHIYPNGWNQGAGHSVQPGDMDELKNTGRHCIIGEFGPGSGPVDVSAVVSHAKQIGFLGVIGWAWNGDGGSLNMCTPSWSQNARASSYSQTSYFYEIMNLL